MNLTRKPTPMTAGIPPETAHRPEAGFSEEQVRKRAYQIFLSRQREGVPGDPISDWVRAEQELRVRSR